MNTYFRNVTTLEELRRQYKDLLKLYHPDNAETTQELNAEYDVLFRELKDRHERTSDNSQDNDRMKQHFHDACVDAKLREILQQIIAFKDINIEIIGNWIWVDGNTYPIKDELHTLGFIWSKQRKKWYWTSTVGYKKRSSKLSFTDIQNKYGSTAVRPQQRELLQQA